MKPWAKAPGCDRCGQQRPDIRWDGVLRVRLCDPCWATIDPVEYGISQPAAEALKRRPIAE